MILSKKVEKLSNDVKVIKGNEKHEIKFKEIKFNEKLEDIKFPPIAEIKPTINWPENIGMNEYPSILDGYVLLNNINNINNSNNVNSINNVNNGNNVNTIFDVYKDRKTPILFLTSNVLLKLKYILSKTAGVIGECGGFLLLRRLNSTYPQWEAFDLFMPGQEASQASVDIQDTSLKGYLQYLDEKYPNEIKKAALNEAAKAKDIIAHWHSHGNMGAFWSGTDIKQQEDPNQTGFMSDQQLFLVVSNTGMQACYMQYKPVFMGRLDNVLIGVKYESINGINYKEEINRFLENFVARKTYTFSHIGGIGYTYGQDFNYDYEYDYWKKHEHFKRVGSTTSTTEKKEENETINKTQKLENWYDILTSLEERLFSFTISDMVKYLKKLNKKSSEVLNLIEDRIDYIINEEIERYANESDVSISTIKKVYELIEESVKYVLSLEVNGIIKSEKGDFTNENEEMLEKLDILMVDITYNILNVLFGKMEDEYEALEIYDMLSDIYKTDVTTICDEYLSTIALSY